MPQKSIRVFVSTQYTCSPVLNEVEKVQFSPH